jgi:glycosyltransferase involved in cell wall biosynthesis
MHPKSANPVALCHHWLVNMRGGEKVFQELGAMFPEAPVHALLVDPVKLESDLRARKITPSALQRLPGAARNHTRMLPLFPWATRTVKIDPNTKLVVCSDAAVIKGAPVPRSAKLVCYCHSPPRYLWDLREEYARRTAGLGVVGRMVFRAVVPYVRKFDQKAAQRVDLFVANSEFVRHRIKNCYGKDSLVVHPFVDLGSFAPSGKEPDDFYLIVSQLVPYKRVDVAIEAFRQLGKKLVVIGAGSESRQLQTSAPRNVEFLGAQPLSVLQDHYRRCRALIFPGVEDFGITPLEAMASGRPVIAYGEGGVMETVIDRVTGFFFREQTPESLASAVRNFEALSVDPQACRLRAEQFTRERFRSEMQQAIALVGGRT